MKIRKGIETQIIVKAFLIVSVAAFNLSVMPWGSRTDKLVLYLAVITEYVKRMDAIGLFEVSKFRSVVGLDRFGRITKEDDRAFCKVYGRIAAVFFVGIDKTLS